VDPGCQCNLQRTGTTPAAPLALTVGTLVGLSARRRRRARPPSQK
jgi:hypothetical protein